MDSLPYDHSSLFLLGDIAFVQTEPNTDRTYNFTGWSHFINKWSKVRIVDIERKKTVLGTLNTIYIVKPLNPNDYAFIYGGTTRHSGVSYKNPDGCRLSGVQSMRPQDLCRKVPFLIKEDDLPIF